MSDQPDPERLLAEALRAQAVRAPHVSAPHVSAQHAPTPMAPPEPPTAGSLGLFSDSPYGLLSGQDSYRIEPHTSIQTPYVPPRPVARPMPVGWIVLLAVLLGLAAGAVTGLVSVL